MALKAFAPVLFEYLRCCCITKATVSFHGCCPATVLYVTLHSLRLFILHSLPVYQNFFPSRRLCLWHLLPPSASFLVAQFSRRFLSNCSCCSLLKAAHPKRFLDNVQAGPDVPPSTMIQGSAVSCTPHRLPVWAQCKVPPKGTEAWVSSPLYRMGDTAIVCHLHGNLCSWPVCCNGFVPGQGPSSDVGGHNCGCHVGGPLNLPWWRSLWELNSVGCLSFKVLKTHEPS